MQSAASGEQLEQQKSSCSLVAVGGGAAENKNRRAAQEQTTAQSESTRQYNVQIDDDDEQKETQSQVRVVVGGVASQEEKLKATQTSTTTRPPISDHHDEEEEKIASCAPSDIRDLYQNCAVQRRRTSFDTKHVLARRRLSTSTTTTTTTTNSTSSDKPTTNLAYDNENRNSTTTPSQEQQLYVSQQQRIKVTLSKPKRDSSEEQRRRSTGASGDGCELVYDISKVVPTSISTAPSLVILGGNTDQQLANSQASTPTQPATPTNSNDICRSTATLISAIGSISGGQQSSGATQFQSTSACDSQRNFCSSSSSAQIVTTNQVAQPTTTTKLTRSEQENQLRRIASQRYKSTATTPPPPPPKHLIDCSGGSEEATKTQEKTTSTSARQAQVKVKSSSPSISILSSKSCAQRQESEFFSPSSSPQAPQTSRVEICSTSNDKNNNNNNNTLLQAADTTKIQSKTSEQLVLTQQQQQKLQQLQTGNAGQTKQLAIYINGKIRSNSIFCTRSVSSNSFSSILKSFHGGGGGAGSCATSSGDQQQSSRSPEQATTSGGAGQQNINEQNPFVTCLIPASPISARTSASGSGCGGAAHRANSGTTGTESCQVNQFVPSFLSKNLLSLRKFVGVGGGGAGSANSETGSCKITTNLESHIARQDDHCDASQTSATNSSEVSKTFKLNPSSMFLRKAMRYYRLWIYSANLTILIGTLIFLLAALYVTSDYRFRLILAAPSSAESSSSSLVSWRPEVATGNGTTHNLTNYENNNDNNNQNDEIFQFVSLSEPSLWLAYAVIALQLGALQALGFVGAIRMRERLIQLFWYLILVLILFDIIYLLYWLQRYNQMLRTFPMELNSRLRSQYGLPPLINIDDDRRADVTTHFRSGALTHIFDQVQVESECCGVRNAADYKRSKWREMKLIELAKRLDYNLEKNNNNNNNSKTTTTTTTAQDDRRQLIELLHQVPLVPTSCCRRRKQATSGETNNENNNNVINEPLDDSQLPARPRVPAWSPSMVVDNLALGGGGGGGGGGGAGAKSSRRARPNMRAEVSDGPPTLADVIDKRWSGRTLDYDRKLSISDEQVDEQDDNSNRISGRLKSKQGHYASGSDIAAGQEDSNDQRRRRRRRRREAPAPEVVSLAQLVELIEATNVLDGVSGGGGANSTSGESTLELTWPVNEWSRRVELERRLEQLRNYLLIDQSTANETLSSSSSSFRWPNELQLNYDQFLLIESFIQRELSIDEFHEDEDDEDYATLARSSAPNAKSKRSIDLATGSNDNGDDNLTARRRAEYLKLIRQVIMEDSELGGGGGTGSGATGSCDEWPARSHFDESRIYTRGCQVYLRAWLQSSGNILFVMGFCVLTVLKFCSLILLRLEIREMIHKIRVLKGMATEYTALHELEPYLPRPSVCTQPAELTAGGVATTGAAPSTGSGQALNAGAGGASSPTSMPSVPRRLGGSFSEAVAAATAVAQQQKQLAAAEQHCCQHPYQHLFQGYTRRAGSLANCARAVSTKTIGAPLTLSACPSTLTCGLNTSGGGGGGAAAAAAAAASMLQAPLGSGRSLRINSATLCPCVSSSLSVAHLSQGTGGTGSSLLRQQQQQQQQHHHHHHHHHHNHLAPQQHSNSLRSELFPISMPRRHTAISVCPAALTSSPATGASSRRGTYALVNTSLQSSTEVQQQQQVINALAGSCNQQQQQQQNSMLLAEARSLNYLNQHRHSAHAGAIQANLSFGARGGANTSGGSDQARQSSSARLQQPKPSNKQLLSAGQSIEAAGTSGGGSQTNSAPAFKRQSSGGAQSAINYSLEISPTHSMESRKSIY